ncbi:hypothetical protein UO65_0432 [Actinokineospora spheciospongiae]|uniref:Uncharacterized protein n=2 Tax=Actinokineospora spheciospongiae TaxID=909613 RepID=W7J5B8_9PSEU|nr:hypothetical protein UO65_0432 [Actinokineospora spheciospongiae]
MDFSSASGMFSGINQNSPNHGTQNYITAALDGEALASLLRRTAPQTVAADGLSWLRARFVRPTGFDAMLSRVRPEGSTLLLGGKSGAGKEATARMLLSRTEGEPIRLISVQPEDGGSLIEPDAVLSGDNLLLHLSEADEKTFDACCRRLVGLRAEVAVKRARLVVVLPPWAERRLPPDLRPLCTEVVAPDRIAVLRSHLETHDLDLRADEVPADLRGQIEELGMDGVAELVHHAVATAGGIIERLRTALAVIHEQASAVTRMMSDLDTRARALSAALALLEGGSVDVVAAAERELLEQVEYTEEPAPQLQDVGLTIRASRLQAVVEQRRVRFDNTWRGQAVLAHLWDAYPQMHAVFASWVSAVGLDRTTDDADLERITERFVSQAMRAGYVDDVLSVVVNWADKRKPLREQALALLGRAAVDDRFGYLARRRVYFWSRDPALSPALAEAVVAVCERVLGVDFPNQAIVRLRYLAEHPDAATAALATAALVRLTEDRQMLRRFLADGESTTRPAVFRAVVRPERLVSAGPGGKSLLANSAVRAQVVAGWRAALADEGWADTAMTWMATGSPAVMDVLVTACAGAWGPLADLFAANRRLLRLSPEDERVRRAAIDMERRIQLVRDPLAVGTKEEQRC